MINSTTHTLAYSNNGYYYIHSADMAAPIIAGYRYVSSKQVGGIWHHAYRTGHEVRK